MTPKERRYSPDVACHASFFKEQFEVPRRQDPGAVEVPQDQQVGIHRHQVFGAGSLQTVQDVVVARVAADALV